MVNNDNVCDEEVFRKIHSELGDKLSNFLYYKYGDFEKAKDFAQESFIRLWNNCQKVSYLKAKSFLYTVANRLFLDDFDHQKVKLRFKTKTKRSESYLESNPEYLYRHDEFKGELESAISSLTDNQRSVFLMSRIDKMKNKEIAVTLEVSIKTVEKHIANALRILKEKLEELNHTKI